MSSQLLAIATCRVSSDVQLLNNSLNRQRDAVLRAATELGVGIPEDGWWSGSVSSKRGTNTERKDLKAMIAYCKKNKRVKYLIVDEPDRFMRSIDEAAYFEVTFRRLGVTVWYASDPELNKGDLASKLLKFTKYLSAEGSNEERQLKSISGHTKALMEGRYPSAPKPGYKRGFEKAIHEVYKPHGLPLKAILVKIANRSITPSQGLVMYNKVRAKVNLSPIKLDKFRRIVADPYYAGIVEMDEQVKYRNENGLHEALISKEQHRQLVTIIRGKEKNQTGPRKGGNPKYPMNNLVSCDLCSATPNGRIVGFDHSNGKPNSKVYEKYRCRACKRYWFRSEIHEMIKQHFQAHTITDSGRDELIKALRIVWKQREGDVAQESIRMKHEIESTIHAISQQVEAISDPENSSIRQEILAVIDKKKQKRVELEERLEDLESSVKQNQEQFLIFAFKFVEDMGSKFLEISPENRLRCKQIIFPAGFHLDKNGKVYTPEISHLYRLATKKKDAETSSLTQMVQHVSKSLHPIRDEIAGWRTILEVPYQEYVLNR